MKRMYRIGVGIAAVLLAAALPSAASAGVVMYGDADMLGTGSYGSDPTAGAILEGLAPGLITSSVNAYGHAWPFSPGSGDYAGTDQIYVGSVQTASIDGYSASEERIRGPQFIDLAYGTLIPTGYKVDTLTLGIAADDFQYPWNQQPFSAQINGTVDAALTGLLNSLSQTGPVVQFFTIGIDPALLTSDNVLRLAIDEGGNGGDGWAIDFLTVGLTTSPEPATLCLMGAGVAGLVARRFRRK
jgi:hypothetical protein